MATDTVKILGFSGSLRKDSYNSAALRAAQQLVPQGAELEIFDKLRDIPLFDQDHEKNPGPAVTDLKTRVRQADAILFVTPEYNYSIPGVLKNAIDTASRPYGQSAWQHKLAGVIGVSTGAIGTACAQKDLRTVLAYLDMPTLGQPEAFLHAKEGFFDADGQVNAKSRDFVQKWVDAYVAWVKAHAPRVANAERRAA